MAVDRKKQDQSKAATQAVAAEDKSSDEEDSYAEKLAQAAELDAVTRNPKTVMHTTYRGRY